MVKFLDLHKQYLTIKDEIDQAIADVIKSSAFIGGKYVQIFEDEFAEYVGVDNCIGCGNGTDALEIALESLALPVGSEVLVPANTFIATSEAVTRAGHKVVFVDCKEDDYTIDLADAAKKITKKTKVIIPVHLYGHPADMNTVLDLAKEYNLKVIEDCAQAHGAEYYGKRVGSLGDIATFSFYPGKNLGAYGDAGAICIYDSRLAKRCRMIANHGRITKYDHEFEGRNSRLDGIQAAVLSVKLKYLNEWITKRRLVAKTYNKLLTRLPFITLPIEKNNVKHVYHLYVIRVKEREALVKHFLKNNIPLGMHYPISLPDLKAYSCLDDYNSFKKSRLLAGEVVSLPIGEHLREEDIEQVVKCLETF